MITVAGISPSLDITYVVDDLRLGEIHRPSAVRQVPGGKSLNLARAAHTVGGDVHLVGLFGGATGRQLAEELAAADVGVDVVETDAETRTCVSIASSADGSLTEVYPRAPQLSAAVWDAFEARLAEALGSRQGWLAVSGSAPQGLPPDALGGLVERAHEAGVRVAIDTHSAALPAAVAARPELIKINRSEAAGLLGCGPDEDLIMMAEQLAGRTGRAVVLTDGADGSVAVDGADRWRVRAAERSGHFPVGSGDSYLGGLVSALDRGDGLAEALRWASACGTANALVPGAAVFERADAEAIHDRLAVERVS